MRFYDSGFHTVTPRAALLRPAPVNPKGMFKENLLSPFPLYPSARSRVPSRGQHFCVPRAPKMFPINREGQAESKGRERERADGSSRIITLADSLGEIQSQRKFHLSLIYFGL